MIACSICQKEPADFDGMCKGCEKFNFGYEKAHDGTGERKKRPVTYMKVPAGSQV